MIYFFPGFWKLYESGLDWARADNIRNTIRELVPFPHQGHRRTDLTSRPVRFQTVRKYLIAYAPEEKPLLVLAILHGRRSPRVVAAILRGRDD